MGFGISVALLIWNTWTDLKKREIFWIPTLAALASGVLIHLAAGDMVVSEWLAGIGIGGLLSVVSILTGQAIGMGDCLTIAACGSLMGFHQTGAMLFAALLTAALFSLFQLCVRKQSRKSTFPFMPFLLAGALLTVVL